VALLVKPVKETKLMTTDGKLVDVGPDAPIMFFSSSKKVTSRFKVKNPETGEYEMNEALRERLPMRARMETFQAGKYKSFRLV
jgi:hypothetical protein